MYWPAPTMQYYRAFYGRGAMQLTWAGNYDGYGTYRAFPSVGAGHQYADNRITHTSTHYWADPRDENGNVTQAPRQWFPRFDPSDVASNPFYACDSAGFYWASKNTGGRLNINRTADQGVTTDAVGRASVLVNGGGYGFAERQGYAVYVERYLGDSVGTDATRTFDVTYRGKNTMSMWTSRRSDLVSAWLLLVAGMLGHPTVYAATPDAAKRATAADTKDLQARIGEVIKGRDDFPEEPMSSLKLEKSLYWSAAQGGRLLVPVTIRFKGLVNSYCRVLTQMSGQAEAVLVDVPEQVNYDACRGFDTVRYLDINGDGALDIAASLSVKSNTANAYVAEQAVFLSGADNPSGYCYSDSASRNLKPADMQSESKIANALEQERKRLAVAKFECASQPKR